MTPGTPITAANHEQVKAGDVIAFARENCGAVAQYPSGKEVTVFAVIDASIGISSDLCERDWWFHYDSDNEPRFVFVRPAQ